MYKDASIFYDKESQSKSVHLSHCWKEETPILSEVGGSAALFPRWPGP